MERGITPFGPVFRHWPVDFPLIRPPILHIVHHQFERVIFLKLATYLIQALIRRRLLHHVGHSMVSSRGLYPLAEIWKVHQLYTSAYQEYV